MGISRQAWHQGRRREQRKADQAERMAGTGVRHVCDGRPGFGGRGWEGVQRAAALYAGASVAWCDARMDVAVYSAR